MQPKRVGGYSVEQLRTMMRVEQAALRQEIANLRSETNRMNARLKEAADRLEELERAENLLEGY